MSTTQTDIRRGLQGSIAYKAPVRTASTGDLTLSGLQTVDGVSLSAGDRILVKDQASGAENGIYMAASGAWTRAPDFDGAYDVVEGTLIHVNQGTTNAVSFWRVSTAGTIAVGTDSLSFERVL